MWVCKGCASGDTNLFWCYSDCRGFLKHTAFPLSNMLLLSELFLLKVRWRMLKLPVFNSSSGFAEFKKDVKCSTFHVIVIISSLNYTVIGFMSVCNVSCLSVSWAVIQLQPCKKFMNRSGLGKRKNILWGKIRIAISVVKFCRLKLGKICHFARLTDGG